MDKLIVASPLRLSLAIDGPPGGDRHCPMGGNLRQMLSDH